MYGTLHQIQPSRAHFCIGRARGMVPLHEWSAPTSAPRPARWGGTTTAHTTRKITPYGIWLIGFHFLSLNAKLGTPDARAWWSLALLLR